jgi:DNA-binding NtrC family response regulator
MSEEKFSILVVDDEQVVRESLTHWFTEEGYRVDCAPNAQEALRLLAERYYDLLLLDIRMPGMDGMELQRRLKDQDYDTAVIVMTGYASVETAVAALKQGAFDYVTKPFDPDEFSTVVRNALEQQRLKRENRALREAVEQTDLQNELVGRSPGMQRVEELIRTVAATDATVLIEGESGTGKELVARAIHRCSRRRLLPMVVIHCGALTETLIESELFGHEKGAFTGAQYRKKGKFEVAAGGTVFLDEISDISLKTQTDLLRVLQEREIVRVGGTQPIPVDFRCVAATNKNLAALVKEGSFRSDLFYRLNVFQIVLPPLRERGEDIPLLAAHFLRHFNEQMSRRFTGIDSAAAERLARYGWPGNVRELENAVERAMVIGKEPLLHASDFAVGDSGDPADDRTLEAMERRHILSTLEQFNWNQTQAARALGIDRVTLYHKINRYGLRAMAEPKRVAG